MIPLRHTIGANLMNAGRFAEAEQVYRDDLKRLPENGWSLFGLCQALAAQQTGGAELEATCTFQQSLGQSRCKNHELVSMSTGHGGKM